MKGLLLLALAGALGLPLLADARDMRPGFGAASQAQGEPHKKAPGEPPRGHADKRRHRDGQHRNRLTEEERRELHRDLDRAHREIYRR